MTRVGLVLGAGGIVGQAYHAGVLAALEAELGWDPRTADLIVGSSAGSLTGAALRLGVPAHDLAASAKGEPLSDEGSFLAAFNREGPHLPPFDPRHALRGWRLPSLGLLARTARRPWAFRPGAAAATLMPPGFVDITGPADALAPYLGVHWPAGLWLCAARRDDGARVTFGRPGAPAASLGRAVAASCAIPGYFAPIEIGGVEYLDGGVHSPTNADVLRHEPLDLVIVSSSMSAAHGRTRGPDAGIRWALHRRLDQEVRQLRRAGIEVVRIEPDGDTRAAMGMNAMATDRSGAAAQAAWDATAAYIGQTRVAARLAGLAGNAPRQPAPTA
ncbi:MAG: Patatin [Acidimicrobiales bacterium]|nr:Patatin [Acidimicrobiales bacterium]